MQSSGSVKSLAKSVSEVSLKNSDSKADLVQDQSPRTVTGAQDCRRQGHIQQQKIVEKNQFASRLW